MKVIKIGATWCSGCVIMGPRWEEIEKEWPWLKTQFFDYDEDKEKIDKYGLEKGVIPTFIFLNNEGKEVKRMHGEISKDKLKQEVLKFKADEEGKKIDEVANEVGYKKQASIVDRFKKLFRK
jgi:thiol-disulfide isomerase/thioredoxin